MHTYVKHKRGIAARRNIQRTVREEGGGRERTPRTSPIAPSGSPATNWSWGRGKGGDLRTRAGSPSAQKETLAGSWTLLANRKPCEAVTNRGRVPTSGAVPRLDFGTKGRGAVGHDVRLSVRAGAGEDCATASAVARLLGTRQACQPRKSGGRFGSAAARI